jgi:hypothetical protein
MSGESPHHSAPPVGGQGAAGSRPSDATARVERREHSAAVVGVVVAGVLASVVIPGPYSFGSTMVGGTLLFVLFGYGELPHPTAVREAVGFAAAVAFAALLTFGFVADAVDLRISGWDEGETIRLYEEEVQEWTDGWPVLTAWALLFLAVNAVLYLRRRAYLRGTDMGSASRPPGDAIGPSR